MITQFANRTEARRALRQFRLDRSVRIQPIRHAVDHARFEDRDCAVPDCSEAPAYARRRRSATIESASRWRPGAIGAGDASTARDGLGPFGHSASSSGARSEFPPLHCRFCSNTALRCQQSPRKQPAELRQLMARFCRRRPQSPATWPPNPRVPRRPVELVAYFRYDWDAHRLTWRFDGFGSFRALCNRQCTRHRP